MSSLDPSLSSSSSSSSVPDEECAQELSQLSPALMMDRRSLDEFGEYSSLEKDGEDEDDEADEDKQEVEDEVAVAELISSGTRRFLLLRFVVVVVLSSVSDVGA